MKNWEKNWQRWKVKGDRWKVRLMGPSGELKDFDCQGAYNLHKKYGQLLVEAGKNGGATLVAEKMPNRQ